MSKTPKIEPTTDPGPSKALTKDLAELLNRHSRENASHTPDFILATYMMKCLEAFEEAQNLRASWWGNTASPPGPTEKLEKAGL